ncbi:MAG: DUF6521 family protein [Planctomycetes bacterium]|nr:DUF6521 family protein [Planctomycetota bacterium]
MSDSIDTYAATNPAFSSILLYSYIEGYGSTNSNGLPFPLILLPVPIVLTSDIATAFEGTNTKTGLLSWIARNPEVTVGMRDRLYSTSEFSKQALLFGIRYGVFSLAETGRIFLKPDSLAKKPPSAGSSYVVDAMKLAKRLGAWIGDAGTTETILIALGTNR